MKHKTIEHIKYTRSTDIGGAKGEQTERFVIPTYIPTPNIKAIDVTELNESQRAEALQLWEEYQEYYTNQLQTLFDFSDWMDHTSKNPDFGVKWRTFKPDNIEELD